MTVENNTGRVETPPVTQPPVVEDQAPVEEIKGHPAWQEILDVLPESLHSTVAPTLEKWDKGVKERLEEINSQYSPYKPLIENNIKPEDIEYALWLNSEMVENPSSIVEQAIEAFGLDYVKKTIAEEMQQQQAPIGSDEDDPLAIDITQNPQFIEMQKTLEQIQGSFTETQKAEQEAKALEKHEKELDTLAQTHGNFDREVVNAYMASGLSGEVAVKRYHDSVNQAAAQLIASQQNSNEQQQTPPIVLGGNSDAGSGIPNTDVKLGDLDNKDFNKLVADIVKKAATE